MANEAYDLQKRYQQAMQQSDALLTEDGVEYRVGPSRPLFGDAKSLVDKRMVESPSHYTTGKTETIDYIEQTILTYRQEPTVGYAVGQAIKYLSRAALKGAMAQDLAKAKWYIDRALAHLTRNAATPERNRG
jgi:hypothetical protein